MALAATLIDADTFRVAGDYSANFVVGRKVRAYCGVDGYRFGIVTASSFAAGNTTVDLNEIIDDSGNDSGLTVNLETVEWSLVGVGATGNQWVRNEIEVERYVSFSDAIDSIGGDARVLSVSSTVAVAGNKTVPANVTLKVYQGGLLNVAGGVVLTINSPEHVDADLRDQIFTGAGTVSFTNGGTVYPGWWGATSTVGIQEAIDSLPAAGGRVCVQEGTHTITARINTVSDLILTGIGWSTIIKADPAFVADSLIKVENDTSVTIRDLTVDGSSIALLQGIWLGEGAVNVQVENCYLEDCMAGVHVRGGDNTDLTIVHNYFSGNTYGVWCLQVETSKRWYITGNKFVDGTGWGVTLDAAAYADGLTDVVVDGNLVYNMSDGGDNGGIGAANVQRLAITNNIIDAIDRNGIHIEDRSEYVTIANNIVSNCDMGGIVVYSQPAMLVNRVSIAGNHAYNCVTAPYVAELGGISVVGASAVDGLIIENNIVDLCYGNGIVVGYADDHAVIMGNICRNNNQGAGVNYSGIYVAAIENSIISKNICYDDQTPKTQTYGLWMHVAPTKLIVSDNFLLDNLTGSFLTTGAGVFTDIIYRDNYIQEVPGPGVRSIFLTPGGFVIHTGAPSHIGAPLGGERWDSWAFDDSLDEKVMASFAVPPDWCKPSATLRLLWITNPTVGDVYWQYHLKIATDGEVASGAYEANGNDTVTVPGVAWELEYTEFPIAALAAGDVASVVVGRDGTQGGDTLVGDAYLLGVEMLF